MLQSFKLAIKSIWGNRLRSFLTMLGIIIGVAAVIILVSLINGYSNSVMSSYSNMGVNQINVSVINLTSRWVSSAQVYEFYDKNREIFDNISPRVSISGAVRSGSKTMEQTSVEGCSEQYMSIKGFKLHAGRSILYSDIVSRQDICVVGAYVAKELYKSAENAVGQNIKVGEKMYKIVGVYQVSDKQYLESGGNDDFIWIPYTVAVRAAKNDKIDSYIFTVRDITKSNAGVALLEKFLESILKNKKLYHIMAMSKLLDSLNEQMAMIGGLMGGIAGISLLVAGVGVMNIMLVSVTERTREIGIRKALGANQGVIMQQFIIEAAVTSSLGGILGIIIGCTTTAFVGNVIGLTTVPSLNAILISFGVSVGIGLFFGFMPARRAAGLNPIDALRSD